MDSAGRAKASELSDGGIARRTKSRNQLVEWVLVDGNRILLTLLLSGVVFVSLVVLHQLRIIAFTNDNSITRMASGMIAGSFSLVTLVVSVNQLILSQEFSPAGEFRDRLAAVLEFRRDLEEATSIPATPADPTRLLELLSANIRDRADEVEEDREEHDRNRIVEDAFAFEIVSRSAGASSCWKTVRTAAGSVGTVITPNSNATGNGKSSTNAPTTPTTIAVNGFRSIHPLSDRF